MQIGTGQTATQQISQLQQELSEVQQKNAAQQITAGTSTGTAAPLTADQAVNQRNDINGTAQQLLRDQQSGASADTLQKDYDAGYAKYQAHGGTDTGAQFAAEENEALQNVGPGLHATADDLSAVQSFLHAKFNAPSGE